MCKLNRSFITAAILLLSACANQPPNSYPLEGSYLVSSQNVSTKQSVDNQQSSDTSSANNTLTTARGFKRLPPLQFREAAQSAAQDIASRFSDSSRIEISTDELPLKDFLHYVMGELLKVNYILGDSVKSAKQTVTLNIQESITPRKLFLLTQELVAEKGYVIRMSEDIFYINSEEAVQGKSAVVFGYGQSQDSVPNTTSNVAQIVPFKYKMKGDISVLLPRIVPVTVTPDFQQNSLLLQGRKSDITKALDFIRLIDTPAYRDQFVAAFKSIYTPIKEVELKLSELLKNDGYSGGLSTVLLENQATIILFSADRDLMNRAQFWLEKIDQPADSDEKQYFVFQPLYARASDLAESLAPLLGGVVNSNKHSTNTGNGNGVLSPATSSRPSVTVAGNDKISIVEDARSNSLIINASGKDYRALLPLIERLDVSPKQVMLEVMIVEVTLKDEFRQGLEFFLNNNNYTLGNTGALKAAEGALNYIFTGSARWNVNASLSQTNGLINIVSRPSLLVRDGVTASMSVGSEIPIKSSTTSDGTTASSVQYRKTGLTLNVKPTINSRGVVIMEIDQEVSNQDTSDTKITVDGAPSIFNRKMKTEVVVNSGQTIILGGLISENSGNNETNVPGLSQIPLLGNLFSVKTKTKDKTELAIMITPKIVESGAEWADIKASMGAKLKQIQLINAKQQE